MAQPQALYHLTPQANLVSISQDGLVPQIGPRAALLSEKPAVWLFPDRDSLLQADWLYEMFPEEEPLMVLTINPAFVKTTRTPGLDWEVRSVSAIPRTAIMRYSMLEDFSFSSDPLQP